MLFSPAGLPCRLMSSAGDVMHPGSVTTASRRVRTLSKAVACSIEQLESRQMLTVTTLPNQWSTFSQDASKGTKIYVSSSEGDDNNSGLDPDSPVATLAHAKSLMHSG